MRRSIFIVVALTGIMASSALAGPPSRAGRPTGAAAPAPPAIPVLHCPVIPAEQSLPDSTKRLFAVISDACALRAAGLIDEGQFQSLLQPAVSGIETDIQAMAMESNNHLVAASTPSNSTALSRR